MDNIAKTCTSKEFVKTICQTIKTQASLNIQEKGSFTFVLSGGETPKIIFEELVLNYKDLIDWSKVHFFWLDERCVPPANENSNYKLGNDHLISKLPGVGSIHRIKGEMIPYKAAKEYENDILNFFGTSKFQFDFLLLGMGEKDGHIASLFPESSEIQKSDEIVIVTDREYFNYYRVTLGLDIINMSKFKLLMVNNSNKKLIISSKDLYYPINRVKDKMIVLLN